MKGISCFVARNNIQVGMTNNSEIAISIIIPVHNLEEYIKDCVDSILNQSLKNFELILVDDYSNDNTKKIIKEYISNENNRDIILIENERNFGAGYSRNRGLEIARGKYLLFLDGDDVFECNMLEKLFHACEEVEADVAIFNFVFFDNDTHESVKYNAPIDTLINLTGCFQLSDIGDCAFQYLREMAWNKIFRREFIIEEGIRFQCQNNANDQFFVYAGLLKAKKIIKLSDYLLRYRTNRKNQLSTSGNISRYPMCIWNALKATLQCVEKIGLYELYKRSYNIYAVQRTLFSLEKVNMIERENLLKYYRDKGLEALKLKSLNFQDFGIPYYYAVYTWLLNLVSPEELVKINNWNIWNDTSKCEQLFQNLMKENNIIVWGVGKNGEAFLEKANDNKLHIKMVIDMDENKIGQIIQGHMIKHFDSIDDGDLIIVTNPNHIFTIRHIMTWQKKKVSILDARAYLCYNISFAQSKIEAL